MISDQVLRLWAEKKTAFGIAFGGAHGEAVLDDLGPYCHEKWTTFHTDTAIRNVLEGRRQVILRIREFLEITPAQLVVRNINLGKPLEGDKADD